MLAESGTDDWTGISQTSVSAAQGWSGISGGGFGVSLFQIAGDIRVGFPGVGGVRPCVGPLAISDFAEKPPGRKVGGFQPASRPVSGVEQNYPLFS